MRVLVMGLPGSGKTTLANRLGTVLATAHASTAIFNADEIRTQFNDWDFSPAGRLRQARRMRALADEATADFAIADFVAPLTEMRDLYAADWTIWLDTIDAGRFEDTNRMFAPPEGYDFRVPEQDAAKWAEFIADHLLHQRRRPVFNWQKETVQLLGRWQPWHAGHRALFERALAKTGQVVIQIRDCCGTHGSNPFAPEQVKAFIRRDLDPLYQGCYEIQVVPNIVNITYGRNVGYVIEQEVFDDAIHAISATGMRHQLGLR